MLGGLTPSRIPAGVAPDAGSDGLHVVATYGLGPPLCCCPAGPCRPGALPPRVGPPAGLSSSCRRTGHHCPQAHRAWGRGRRRSPGQRHGLRPGGDPDRVGPPGDGDRIGPALRDHLRHGDGRLPRRAERRSDHRADRAGPVRPDCSRGDHLVRLPSGWECPEHPLGDCQGHGSRVLGHDQWRSRGQGRRDGQRRRSQSRGPGVRRWVQCTDQHDHPGGLDRQPVRVCWPWHPRRRYSCRPEQRGRGGGGGPQRLPLRPQGDGSAAGAMWGDDLQPDHSAQLGRQ